MFEYFPYKTLRPHQDEFIELVRDVVKRGEKVIIEAPTGFGKTISVLAGVLPHAISFGYKVIYLARTHKQMDRVIEELKRIREIAKVSGIEFRSRKDLCLHSYIRTFAQDAYTSMIVCKSLKRLGKCKYFENLKEKRDKVKEIVEFFLENPSYPWEVIEYSNLLELCPYEVTRKVGEKANVIVASYLYMVNPWIRQAFLDGLGLEYSDLIVIFDEAHNLPDQAISALSDRLSIRSVERAIKEANEYGEKDIENFLSIFLRGLEIIYKEKLENYEISEVPLSPASIFEHVSSILGLRERDLLRFLQEMVEVGDAIREDKIERNLPPRSYVGRVGEFLWNWISLADRSDYLHVFTREKGLALEIVALDPSVALEFLEDVHSAILMSGTLSPLEAFRDIIGVNARLKKFPRMVKSENAIVLVARDVSTRGEERSPVLYKKLAEYIFEAVKIIPKNVGVFTASYEVLEGLISTNVHIRIEEEIGKKVFIEKRDASSSENDALVAEFKAEAKGNGGVLFGVMGGRNSEGQDYSGDEMNGVILVGIPYARPTPRVQAQIRYYEKKFPGKGRYYGYLLPAHRKLAQAAGRVHRSEEEKGSIVILDYRVLWNTVKRDLPDWMVETMQPVTLPLMRIKLRKFWRAVK
ncbi:helicase C-terminal domain-containing protein [Pyrococcus abyssi]|uniref:DNA 5'-3' helicase n=1 Tax=Pyrococcus abyssi (strain GE5 / Orsay) TaxID=272844 RepID=Q9UZ12_PYRAB|nr:helicase C-terminal domain-containing protein [Pyrococcus abyssi]CAB50250.1 ERCC2/XPD/rad3 DNA repair helicase, TFIIH helicase beta subunit homolog [Pyrococcus abyssi GE5]CCE70788.1 TPA: DNA repair helicase rad3 [Pyrococcus abyssi GE5]